ncbi:MAG: hypothetical protein GWP91_14850 [Rhodobacterales bacterium]|nr:hypothetical protein [Rhodobacterales bacterium]
MQSFSRALEAAESLAEEGDFDTALAQLDALLSGLAPGPASKLHLMRCTLIARAGRLEDALEAFTRSEALANASKRTDVVLEGQVTRASILAALGDYDRAIPLLAKTIQALSEHEQLSVLHADAVAELKSYRTLVSPNTRQKWAAMLGR